MLAVTLPYEIYEEESKRTYEAFIEACEWLKSLGLFPPGNRFQIYAKIIEKFPHKATDESFEDDFHKYISAAGEAAELIRTKKFLQKVDSEEYINQLRRITSGTAFKSNAANDAGRDYAFELSMAGRLIASGNPVKLGHLADIITTTLGVNIYVECKRIKSDAQVLKRLKEASEQIKKRVNSSASSKCKGLVACNITKVLNPNELHSITNTPGQIQSINDDAIQDYISTNKEEISKTFTKKQIGIFFESTMHGVITPNPEIKNKLQIVHCRGGVFYQDHPKYEDSQIATKITANIANHHIF